MALKKVKRSLKGIRKRPKMLGPQTEQDKRFCERWLIHFDKDRAYREAGFSTAGNAGHLATSKLHKFADYLRPIREAKAKIMAERLSIHSEKLVHGMAEKVFYDVASFFERTDEPIMEEVEIRGEDGETRTEIRMKTWHGKPIYGERLKPFTDLTPEQQAVVEVEHDRFGVVSYRLPTIMEQHAYLTSLGKQLGMFSEKLIMERHVHSHVHQHLTFDNVPTQKLNALALQLLPLAGEEFAKALGYSASDVEAAQRESGVLVP